MKKEELRRPFVEAGLGGVDTFIASGNVVVDGPGLDPDEIEARVEAAIQTAFGFHSDAFARTLPALRALAEGEAARAAEEEGFTPHAIFLRGAPDGAATEALAGLETEDDRFPVLGREVLWLRRGRLTDSAIAPRHLEKALGGVPNTMRKVNTLRRMVAKFG